MQENAIILWKWNSPSPSVRQDSQYGSLGSGPWSPPDSAWRPDTHSPIFQCTTSLEQCPAVLWSWRGVQQNTPVHQSVEVRANHSLSPSQHWQSAKYSIITISSTLKCGSKTVNTLWVMSYSFTSHSTYNRSFWRRSQSQSLGLVYKN